MRPRRKPPRRLRPAEDYAFPPLSDEELRALLDELMASLPDDLAATAREALAGGSGPGEVARMVRDELRSRGQMPGPAET